MKKNHPYEEYQNLIDKGYSWRDLTNHGIGHKIIYRGVQQGLLKFPGRKEAIERSKLQGKYNSGGRTGSRHTEESKQKLRDHALRRGLGGTTNSKKNPYVTKSGDTVYLDSSYETKVAEDLDKNDVKWIRPKRKQWLDQSGKTRFYTADFFLPDYNVYLDPKNNYLISQDKEKIARVQNQQNIRILILNSSQLSWDEIRKML